MKRYRIITKEILVDNVYDQEEALTIVQMFAEKGVKAEYEPFDFVPEEAKRMGRDPDLH